MKKWLLWCLVVLLVALTGCTPQEEPAPSQGDQVTFQATVLEIFDTYVLVEPAPGSQELRSADQIQVSTQTLESPRPLQVGDTLVIVYSGGIQETYPAQLTQIDSVSLLQE